MPTLTIENYVKAIYQLTTQVEQETASTGAIAQALDVAPSSVTGMLKTLSDRELAEHRPYGGVRLTPRGEQLALRMLRRHRLIELFLVQTLSLSWDEVHDEAEHLEHAVSDLLVDRIDRFLEFPELDPHGDPIPKSDGSLTIASYRTLSSCLVGEELTLRRVLDQSATFLRFLTDAGLELGSTFTLRSAELAAGTITLENHVQKTTISLPAAERLLVEVEQKR